MTKAASVRLTNLKAVIGLLVFFTAFPARGTPSKLTEEEARRPWREWTEEQLIEKGWTPYNDQEEEAVEGRRWLQNDPGSSRLGACVFYSFISIPIAMDSGTNCYPDCMPAASENSINAAVEIWEDTADVHLVLSYDNGLPHNAPGAIQDIRIGAHSFPPDVLGHAYFPPPNGVTQAGDLHFSRDVHWVNIGPAPGPPYDVLTVALHELGHSLGLNHDEALPGDVMFGMYTGINRVPKAGDIGFLRSIYGPPGHFGECTITAIPIPVLSDHLLIVYFLLTIFSAMWFFWQRKRNA